MPYPRGHDFTQDDLKGITADEIVRWAKHRIYGNPDADDAVDPPLNHRHNSVLNWKKALSFFMPNAHLQWNDDSQTGNPTRSRQMASLLKNVKRMQVQRRGAPSRVRRSMHPDEYKQMMKLISHLDIKELAICAAAYFCFQFAMIGRLDDTAKFRQPDLKPYDKYPDYAFMSRLPWSKNVREERDAPQQLVFAAMDPWYDTHSLLGIWLEYRFEVHPEENEFIFCVNGLEDPIRIKDKIREVLVKIFRDDEFVIRDLGLLGTHSIRKFAVTFARGCGCSKVSVGLFFHF